MENYNSSIPLVSICCVAYNHEKFIKDCLEGFITQQTSFPFEILVHEDASTDNTAGIIKEYELKYPFLFRCVYQTENQFLKQNTLSNILLPMARGKYIAMCEGDDYWTDKHKLQKQVDFLESNSEYSISFHKVKILENGKLVDDYKTEVHGEITSQKDLLYNTNYIHTVSVVFRNIMNRMPDWFSRAMPGDYPLWMMLTANNYKIKYFQDVMAVYRVHSNGIWSTQDTSKYKQRIAFTMLSCAKHLDVNPPFVQYYILSLAESIKKFGFEYLSHREYLDLAIWSLKSTHMGMKSKLAILTVGYRKNLGLIK